MFSSEGSYLLHASMTPFMISSIRVDTERLATPFNAAFERSLPSVTSVMNSQIYSIHKWFEAFWKKTRKLRHLSKVHFIIMISKSTFSRINLLALCASECFILWLFFIASNSCHLALNINIRNVIYSKIWNNYKLT